MQEGIGIDVDGGALSLFDHLPTSGKQLDNETVGVVLEFDVLTHRCSG
jgi:hypothetical protein